MPINRPQLGHHAVSIFFFLYLFCLFCLPVFGFPGLMFPCVLVLGGKRQRPWRQRIGVWCDGKKITMMDLWSKIRILLECQVSWMTLLKSLLLLYSIFIIIHQHPNSLPSLSVVRFLLIDSSCLQIDILGVRWTKYKPQGNWFIFPHSFFSIYSRYSLAYEYDLNDINLTQTTYVI